MTVGTDYRPELDGIRGVAVLLVLLSHARVPGFEGGGMVGVTLFFVLSGYLITGLLRAELERSGRIDLRTFYVRRIRRLLPALVALLVATGLLMAALGRFAEYPGQALPVIAYGANIAQGTGANLGYLAHTWSLSLEEQFYLVWPALFILARGRRALLVVLLVGIAASMLTRQATPYSQLAANGIGVRVDAVLWGCAIAFGRIQMPRWTGPVAIGALLAWSTLNPDAFGLGLSGAAILSTVAVASARPGVLSWRPLVRTGQISYGLYLWQLAPALLLVGNPAAVIAISFALALASERWIERPLRSPTVLRDAVEGRARPSLPAPAIRRDGDLGDRRRRSPGRDVVVEPGVAG